MRKIIFLCCSIISFSVFAQNEQKYSAVNPALFLYSTEDVYINPPMKYNDGRNIISPDPTHYPWEDKLENGMPNVIMDNNGNLAIYISCFLVHSNIPYSKVGAFVYTNNTTNVNSWTRPDAGLYWYNPAGKTVDDKISPVAGVGFQSSNIVAVDIESVGIYDDYEVTNKPIKLIYLPQRESENQRLAGYEMERNFNANGVLSDFAKLKNDRKSQEKIFTFRFINGDTHMNYLKQNGKYYFVSRINAKRSMLKSGETLPFTVDPRIRYRRETLTEVGENLVSKKVDFNVILDMSNTQWEPYSLQPFRLPGFEKDLWWGIVTAFGTRADETVANRQRTELAISCDGIIWKYLKPGIPFLDNGTDPKSDDYGCINMAKPVINTKFSSSSRLDMYYFYAASRQLHVAKRNSGISLAIGKYGKMAGLRAEQIEKVFYSMEPTTYPITIDEMPKFSIYEAFRDGSSSFPYVLADVTEDPRGKSLSQLNSYAVVSIYSYAASGEHGKGAFLSGTLGSSVKGTKSVSDNYEAVGYVAAGKDGNSKQTLLTYLKDYSDLHPQELVSIKDFPEIPIVAEAKTKNAVLYGIKFNEGVAANRVCLNLTAPSNYRGGNLWSYKPENPQHPCRTQDFTDVKMLPNQKLPVHKETGSIALKFIPKRGSTRQTLIRIYGDTNGNDIGIYYTPSGSLECIVQKDATSFASMTVKPPAGKMFDECETIITFEAVKRADQKYGKTETSEEVSAFRVYCPSIGVNTIVKQPILWEWKHTEGSITDEDRANARAFAYLDFTSFVASMNKITVGGKNLQCEEPFLGSIKCVEIAQKLPAGSSDFWSDTNSTTTVPVKYAGQKE